MEGKHQKNMTIELNIKTVSLKVTETSPIVVYWARGTMIMSPFITLIIYAEY